MPKALERKEYGPLQATGGGKTGDRIILKIVSEAKNYLNPGGVLYFPVFSFSNPEGVKKFSKQNYSSSEVVASHDVIFDYHKLTSMDKFKAIYDAGEGYEVKYNQHPYWRIEIVRCLK